MQHATLTTEQVRALIARGKLRDTLFQALGIFFLGVGLIVIFLLVGDMVLRGAGRLNLDFFTQFASRRAGSAGILSAWVGSLLVMTVTAFAAASGAARILAGEFSDGVTAGGKAGPDGPRGARQGINNYREWFAGDPAMAGDYFGYDGPCPPWNDSIVHH